MITPSDKPEDNLHCIEAMGLTTKERWAVEMLAPIFVDCGDLPELLRQFNNQIINECKRANIDWAPIIETIVGCFTGQSGYGYTTDDVAGDEPVSPIGNL